MLQHNLSVFFNGSKEREGSFLRVFHSAELFLLKPEVNERDEEENLNNTSAFNQISHLLGFQRTGN